MSFIWPPVLLLLLAIPVGMWVYGLREGRRADRAAAFGWGSAGEAGAGAAVATSSGRRTPWIRRIPAACTVAGVTILVLSLARPESVIGVPRFEGTIVLAFDVSGSMAATDVAPTRMETAKSAALSFVERQPPSVRIGVVVFSDSGFSTQVPTVDRLAISTAIQRLEPQRGTSLGRGILDSLAAIEAADAEDSTDYYSNGTPVPTPVPAGVYEAAGIVLLSDGENTTDPDPFLAAQAARDRGVRVDTVGIGTSAGVTLEIEDFLVHTSLDEATLRQIAAVTDGTYYAATEADDIAAIHQDIGRRLVVRSEPFELTPLFALVGFALLVVGGLGSLRWFGRLP